MSFQFRRGAGTSALAEGELGVKTGVSPWELWLGTSAGNVKVGDVSGYQPLDADLTQIAGLTRNRGDLIVGGASAWIDLAIGAANKILFSDGTDPSWTSLSEAIDAAIGSTRGSILIRGVAGWIILAPGTSGHVLTSNGAGADPSYQASAAAADPLTVSLLLMGG